MTAGYVERKRKVFMSRTIHEHRSDVREVRFGRSTIFTSSWGKLTEGGAIAELYFYLDDLFFAQLGSTSIWITK
jgi:hypothetical protein